MVVTLKVATIKKKKKVFAMCYKIFITNGEHKKCCQGEFPQRCGTAWQTVRSCPAQPQQGGEIPSAAPSGVLDHLGGFTNNNVSWTGNLIGNSTFSSSHLFSQKSGWFAEIALL